MPAYGNGAFWVFQSEPWGFRTSRTLDESIRSIVEKFARDRFCFLVDTLFSVSPGWECTRQTGVGSLSERRHASSPRATGSSGWSRLGAGFRRPPRRFHGRIFLPMVEELQDGPGLVADQALRGAPEVGAVGRRRWGRREHGYGRRAVRGATGLAGFGRSSRRGCRSFLRVWGRSSLRPSAVARRMVERTAAEPTALCIRGRGSYRRDRSAAPVSNRLRVKSKRGYSCLSLVRRSNNAGNDYRAAPAGSS